jgi:hypothetical protein
MERAHLFWRHAPRDSEHLDPDHNTVRVEVENDSLLDLLGLDDGIFVEPDIQGVDFVIDVNSHRTLRSKNNVTTRGGSVNSLITTLSQRPPKASIGFK